jgi:hypothetical protein
MGSRTKTYSGLSAGSMFERDDNLWVKEIIRYYGQTKSLESTPLIKTILQDSTYFFNEKVFEKFGASAEIEMEIERFDDASILQTIRNTVDPTATRVLDAFNSDKNGKIVSGSAIKTKEALDAKYAADYDCLTEVYEYLESDVGRVKLTMTFPAYKIDGGLYRIATKQVGDSLLPDGNATEDLAYVYMIAIRAEDDPANPPSYSKCDIISGVKESIYIPVDYRSVMAVVYDTTTITKATWLFSEGITTEMTTDTCMMLMLRENFDDYYPEDSKAHRFLYSRFGLNAPDKDGNTLDDQLDQPDLKNAWLTYASHRHDDMFSSVVSEVYNIPPVNENPNQFTPMVTNMVTIKGATEVRYEYLTNMYEDDLLPDGYRMVHENGWFYCDYFDDEKGEWESRYMIPMNYLKEKILKDKFTAYNRTFTMFVYSEKTVKLKWYQTLFFRFIFMVIALFTVGPMAIAINIGMQVLGKVLEQLDPIISAIIGFAVGLVTGGFSFNFTNILNLANNILSFVMKLNTIMFQKSMEAIQDSIDTLTEKTEELRDEMNDMLNDTVFIRFGDKLEMLYNGVYDLAPATPDLVYRSVDMDRYTNYDKYYELF